MLFLWPFNINILYNLSICIHFEFICKVDLILRKQYDRGLDSYPIYNKTVSSENLIICTGGQEYFKAQLFYLKRTRFILSCFLLNSVFLLYGFFVCVCVLVSF